MACMLVLDFCMAGSLVLTCGLGSGKRVPRMMCFLRTPYCSAPLLPTRTSTFCSAALPHLLQNSRPASCTGVSTAPCCIL